MKFAKLLEIQYQGYFFCRLATDPDPTNEQRGVSGYTMALVHEDPLDQVIRLQIDDEFAARNLREPAQMMKNVRVGVDVCGVTWDGVSFEPAASALAGAKLSLKGATPPFPGPIFDSRNNIVGSDDNMMFVVNPFELEIKSDRVTIEATDYLNPADPEQQIWQIEDPSTYARRLPTAFNGTSTTAMAAIRVFILHTDEDETFLRSSPWFKLMDFIAVREGEPVLVKTTRNAFTSTRLQELLTAAGVRRLAIAGIQTEQCCETTARLAADLGYDVDFVIDATLTFPIADPETGDELSTAEILRRTEFVLRRRFARITPVERLILQVASANAGA